MSRAIHARIGRRTFLAGAAAAGVLTQMELLRTARMANAAAPMRALFVYVPDGCIPSMWHPSGTETNFTLPAMTEPLGIVKDDLIFLKGLDMYAGGATHEGGIRKVLTGVGDLSLDVFLGQKIQGQAPQASVQLGISSNFQNGSGGFSFIGPDQEVKPDDNPINAFTRLFGGVKTGATDDAAELLRQRRRQSVLDATVADLGAIRARLGSAEKAKLDTHLDSIREVERRITATGSCSNVTWNAGGFAVSPTDYYPKTYEQEEKFLTVGNLQMDLAVLALGCDVTRVASLMWSHPVSPTHVVGSGVATGNHDASHYGDPSSQNAKDFVTLKRWFMERFAYLVQKLKATPYGGGTLLDSTVVFLCSELGDSNAHDHKNMPFVLAGGKGAGLKTGRFLDYTGKNAGENEAHTKLLTSIANLVGVNVDRFGNTSKGTGPLAGLL